MIKSAEFYAARVDHLLDGAPARAQCEETFSGPSIDLHLWAIESRRAALTSVEAKRRFLRDIYSVLPAWGMHRMGDTGAKMPRYDRFETAIEGGWQLGTQSVVG